MAKRGGVLTELLRFAAGEITAALQDGATWSETARELDEARGGLVSWPEILESVPTDVAAMLLGASVRSTVRAWLYSGGDPRVLDFESGPADAAVLLRIRADSPAEGGTFSPHGAVHFETECWVRGDTYGGQWLLLTASRCSERAYARVLDRYGSGEVNGLHDLKNHRRRRMVLDAWARSGNVQQAATAAGVSLPAAYRILNRRNDKT